MPAKGSIFRRPPSINLIGKDTAKAYSKQTGQRKDLKQFKEIAYALFEQIARYIVDDVEGFKLPYNMGILLVKRHSPRYKPVDKRKTVLMGQKVYHQNRHSFGDVITATWIKPEQNMYRNIKAYCFKPDRDHLKRPASRACFAGKVYKKIDSRDRYAREMIALDNIQEQYEDKLNKQQPR